MKNEHQSVKRLLYIFLFCMLVPLYAHAQAQESTDQKSVKVYFRQGKSAIEAGAFDNQSALDTLASHIEQNIKANSNSKGRIKITSSVSPEGSVAINDRIVRARAEAISDWVSKHFNLEVGYIIDSLGVDWFTLEQLVAASDKVPYKSEVLDIIKNSPEKVTRNGKTINQREAQLKQLRSGEPYAYIYKNFYPQLRYAAAYTEIWYPPLLTLTSPDTLTFAAEGGRDTITFAKEEGDEAQPTAGSNASWITNITHDGCEISFSVEPNTLAKPRKATITIDHYDNYSYVEVMQQAAEVALTFTSPTPVEVGANGGRTAVSFTTNTSEKVVPVANSQAKWIRNIKCSQSRISFSTTPNTIAEPRTDTITVEALGKVYKIAVNQAASCKASDTAERGDAITTPQLVLDRAETIRVYFRQGSSKLDMNYMDNRSALEQLSELLQPYLMEQSDTKGKVSISSSVSPEGSIAINDKLIKERAKAISRWISKRFNVEVNYVVGSMGVDWDTLITMVEEDEKVPYREEVLDVLYNTPERVVRNGKAINERENTLKRLRKGVPYWYIYTHIYPQLRYAAAYTEIWYASELTITTPSPISFTAEGGKGIVSFSKNTEDKVIPKTTCTADWVKITDSNDKAIEFEVAANAIAQSRSTKIYVECYGKMYEVAVEQQGAEPTFSISDQGITDYPAEGGSGRIEFATNTPEKVAPEASTTAEWIENITVSESSVGYTVTQNAIAAARQDTISLNCLGQTHKVVVTQRGAEPSLSFVTPSPREFDHKGGADTVAFKTNSPEEVTPSVSSEAKWIVGLTPSSDNIAYEVARNRKSEPRSAVISVNCFDKTNEIVVNQAARPKSNIPLPYMSVKTNALYDLLLIPNVGVEFHLGHNFSVASNWHFAWWNSHKLKWFWRTYGGDVSLRYWFGKAAKEKPLTGHHIGLYGQIISYDFELGKKGILAEPWSWSSGVEYGYSLPLASRMNLDFTVGVGYHTGTFHEYLPIDTHYVWQATKIRNYVGPTKLEVSLVWLLGNKNQNNINEGNR